ncbi:hypothetical protein [Streptomyces sp. NPDC026673]|uniref:hypothetical protein n=1 Tax=Streptomyces sp. NPDC026673 TaxID=3155724 RepID=UPI0034018ECD
MAPVTLDMPRQEAWILMVGLQTAAAHPLIAGGPMGACMEKIGRQLQEIICDDPEVYIVAESGWNRSFDVGQGHSTAD